MSKSFKSFILVGILICTVVFGPVTPAQALSLPAQMNKSFNPIAIVAGGTSTLSVTIFNPNTFPLTAAHYHDFFSAGISVANPMNLSNTCGGTVTDDSFVALAPGGTYFRLNGGTVPAQVGASPGECTAMDDVRLEIPSLNVDIPIVGIPFENGNWNLTWLGKDAGYLNGTAFPTHSGNSVITGHAYLPSGLPGPFIDVSTLKWGDRINIHAFGQTYIYEVRYVDYLKPNDVSKALRHEDKSWVTLLTCKSYDEKTDSYRQRVAVRAVLIKVVR